MRAHSLRFRSIFGSTIVVACSLTISSLAVFLFLRAHLNDDLDVLLESRVATVQLLSNELSSEDLVDRLRELGIRATVHMPDGSDLVSAPALPRAAARLPATTEPPVAVKESEVDLQSGDRATVGIARDGVDRALHRLAALQVAAVVLGTTGAAGLVALSSLRAIRPLEEVISRIEQTTADRTSRRLQPEDATSEIGRLASAFDAMLDRLDSARLRTRASDERSRRFLANAAHQLRRPIAASKTTAEAMLVANPADAAERERFLSRIATEMTRASDLIADLLLLARLDEGDAVRTETFDLAEVAQREVQRTAGLAPGLAVTLQAPDSVLIQADWRALSEALSNVLDNAQRHADTRVHVSLVRVEHSVEIAVHDDGPGIPHHLVDQIFERFATFDQSRGTGLGLAIARDVARAHRGDLIYRNRSFVLILPRPPVSGDEQPLAVACNGPFQAETPICRTES